MSKFEFSYDDTRVTIVDSKSKKVDDKLQLLDHVELPVAFRVLTQGRKADAKASDVAISMLADLLNDPRLIEYKGKTAVSEKVDSRFSSALREIETEAFKPAFIAAHIEKGATAGKADQLWQEFRKQELSTGSYSNAKSMVAKLWCHVGASLFAPNGKLLPLYAVRRMYENWKAEQDTTASAKTISDKLVTLSEALKNNTEDMGDIPTAIAALSFMLDTYRTMQTVEAERATNNLAGAVVDVSRIAKAVVNHAKAPSGEQLMEELKDAIAPF